MRPGIALCELPSGLGMPLVSGGGYHAFAAAIPSPMHRRAGVHIVIQLDRSALWTVDGRTVDGQTLQTVRCGEIAIFAAGSSFHGTGGVHYPNAHLWLDLQLAAAHGERHAPFDASERARFAADLRHLGTTVVRGSTGLAMASRQFATCLTTGSPLAILRAAVASLLAHLAEAVHAAPPAARDVLVEKTLVHIDASLADGRLTVARLAAASDLTPTLFSRRFRAATGWSPAAWISFRRTWCAAERLRTSDDSITAVAFVFGFPSSQHLATCIRRHLGVTATAVRAGRTDLTE